MTKRRVLSLVYSEETVRLGSIATGDIRLSDQAEHSLILRNSNFRKKVRYILLQGPFDYRLGHVTFDDRRSVRFAYGLQKVEVEQLVARQAHNL